MVESFRIEEVRNLGHWAMSFLRTPTLQKNGSDMAWRSQRIWLSKLGGLSLDVWDDKSLCLIVWLKMIKMKLQNHNLSEVPVTQNFVKEWFRRDEIARIWVAGRKNDSLAVLMLTCYHWHYLIEEVHMISYGVAPSFSFSISIWGRLCRDKEVALEMLNRMGLRWTWFLAKFVHIFFARYQVCSMWSTWDKWFQIIFFPVHEDAYDAQSIWWAKIVGFSVKYIVQ